MAFVTATVSFLITYGSRCTKLPPPKQLAFYELGGADQDIFAGVDDADSRGLRHFPRLWCACTSHSHITDGHGMHAHRPAARS